MSAAAITTYCVLGAIAVVFLFAIGFVAGIDHERSRQRRARR